MESLLIILIVGGFFFLTILLPLYCQKKDADYAIEKAISELEELSKEVLVVTSSSIQDQKIIKTLGSVSGTSNMAATSEEESEAAEKEAMVSLMKNAIAMGANGVIDLKITTSTYKQQGNEWIVSKIFYIGTAVTIR